MLQVQAGMMVVATLAAPGNFQQVIDTLRMLPVLEDMFCQRGMPGPWSRIFSQRSYFPAKFEELLELLVVPLDTAYKGFLLRLARGELDSFYLEIEPEIGLTSFAHQCVVCCVCCGLRRVSFRSRIANTVIIPGR